MLFFIGLDRSRVRVAKRPRVVVLCTGSELRSPGSVGPVGTIAESISPALRALAMAAGASVQVIGPVLDEPQLLEAALASALEQCDVLLTVGGVSVGDHDHVRPSLTKLGVTLDFWKIRLKPGKPLVVGRRGPVQVLGLPGNPSSALVTFALFGMPLLRRRQGDVRYETMRLPAVWSSAACGSLDRTEVHRVALSVEAGQLHARAHTQQAAGATVSLAGSDGLAIIPQGPERLQPGQSVAVVRWSDL